MSRTIATDRAQHPLVEVRITTSSIAGIDPESNEAYAYSDRDGEGRPRETIERVRADRAQELIEAGAAELIEQADPEGDVLTQGQVEDWAKDERQAMRDRIRLAEREAEEARRLEQEAREAEAERQRVSAQGGR